MHFQKPPLGTPLDWENPLNKGLVLHLAMNEGHGDVVRDLSLNSNHGTLHNMAFPPTPASGWNPGYKGVGLNFDGTNDYISIPHNHSQDITDKITIGMWIYKNVETWGNCVGSGTGNTGYQLSSITTNRVQFFLKSGTAGADGEIKSSALGGIPLKKWTCVVGTYDGAVMKTYLNGVFQASFDWVDTIGVTGSGVFIGRNSIGTNLFNGSIDPIILNRAWTAEEVKDYYINPWQVYLDEYN